MVSWPESATEQRKLLLAAKDELVAEMRKITGPVNDLMAKLVAEADALLPAAADEAGQGTTVKQVTYKKKRKTE